MIVKITMIILIKIMIIKIIKIIIMMIIIIIMILMPRFASQEAVPLLVAGAGHQTNPGQRAVWGNVSGAQGTCSNPGAALP